MKPVFGPWSSAIGGPDAQQLSTFWRQRLGSLALAARCEVAIRRREMLRLVIIGIVMCAWPTMRGVTASGSSEYRAGTDGPSALAAADRLPGQVLMNLSPAGEGKQMEIIAIDPNSGKWQIVTHGYLAAVNRTGKTLGILRDNALWVRIGDKERRLRDFDSEKAEWSFCVSPDGKRIAFSHGKQVEGAATRLESWLVTVDGASEIKLDLRDTDRVHDWSRDGDWLITQSWSDARTAGDRPAIYKVRLDGTDRRHMTEGYVPSWSPDGRLLVFNRGGQSPEGRVENRLFVTDASGANPKEIFYEPEICPVASWSPDGKQIAVSLWPCVFNEDGTTTREGSFEIMNADGSNRRKLDLPAGRLGIPYWR